MNNSMSLLRKRLMEKGATVATTGTLGEREKAEIRQKVLLKTDSIDRKFFAEFENRDTSYERREQIKESVYRIIYGYVREAAANLPGVVDPALAELAREITDEVLGFGIIQVLLDDQNVTEIMIVGPKIWIEKDGIKFRYVRDFQTIEQIYLLIERILAPLPGRRVDEASPIVDARLPDKSRVNIVVRPVAVNGPFITIRKFKRHMNIHELIKRGTLSHRVAGLCKALIRAGFHIIISGNTGSGKTTTANALSGFIPKWHRIVTIEDAVELQLQQEHVLVHESRPPNIAGEGEITIRYLVKNALREYPDWIIVGEVRDAEVVDMLQAANTGHKIITTIHANSPAELPSRIEGMFQRAFTNGVSSSFVAKSIVDGLDLVIHQDRLEETVQGAETVIDFDNWDGEESEEEDVPREVKRRITHITGIIGCQGESVIMQDILRYDRDRDALVVAPGWEKCIPLFQKHRLTFPDWFREGVVL
ncbi:CpaF family protein [Desulfofundulus sp. TPOSR]|uniref:CpaF family protein n=1 Tax=Desulfofundulus sp. TPOSR TaxID=2714340 RepID=UPI001407B547|nr:ATPase, T2SS/T4P/T4SS family [Desulfofundulus sp. TPOSR]NHM28968.1 CpaF family protein [Desulfofundulus sp. TPOSR]